MMFLTVMTTEPLCHPNKQMHVPRSKTYILLHHFRYTNFVKYLKNSNIIFFPSNVLQEDNNLTDALIGPGVPLGVDGSHFVNQRFRTPGDRNKQINFLPYFDLQAYVS